MSQEINEFQLEDLYPKADELFKPYSVPNISRPSVLVALDTNALLLPYTVSKERLPGLDQVYNKLASENRLLLPARVAREFIQHRDRKLAEIVQAINTTKSKLNIGESYLSPVLEGITGNAELIDANKKLSEARKSYSAALDKIEAQLLGWRGNDPVTTMYSKIFSRANIVEPAENREMLSKEWEKRRLQKIPPGYKDANKDDNGIGDFIIWKSLINVGASEKKDIIFITGDEKADWYVRYNNHGLYPRPELVQEYREASQGKNIRLASLHEILKEMKAPSDLVVEVENAERTANSSFNLADELSRLRGAEVKIARRQNIIYPPDEIDLIFPYGGGGKTIHVDGRDFYLEFSEGSSQFVWLYAKRSTVRLNSIDNAAPGEILDREKLKAAEGPVDLWLGGAFFVVNSKFEVLLGRLISVNYDDNSDKESRDLIIGIRYRSFSRRDTLIAP